MSSLPKPTAFLVIALIAPAVSLSQVPSKSDFAVYATGPGCGAITMSGNTYIDSIDSSKGTYAQTKQLSQGHAGVTGNINLSGNPVVDGAIFAVNSTVGQCQNGTPGISLSGLAAATGGYIQLGGLERFGTVNRQQGPRLAARVLSENRAEVNPLRRAPGSGGQQSRIEE